MARRAAVLVALALAACSTTREPTPRVVYRDVHVPVPFRTAAPAELRACPVALPPPRFVAVPPGTAATSGLTPEGERLLRALIGGQLTCIEAWRAWATEGKP